MSTKKQARRERVERELEEHRKKPAKPLKVAVLFVLALLLMFAFAALFGDRFRSPDGRVWSAEHQHYH